LHIESKDYNFTIPKTVNQLSLWNGSKLINNLPEHIEKIFIKFNSDNKLNKKVENMSITIKEIIIENEEYKKYIKIPFETKITIQQFIYYL
jgi:hypothetical protein